MISDPDARAARGVPAGGGTCPFDLLVVGEVNPDVIVRGADPRPAFGQAERWVDTIELVVGSSSAIAACGAARLGLRTAFAGLVGDDALGRFMLAELAARGIDTSAVLIRAGVRTGASVILSTPADRAILTAPGAIPLLRAGDVPVELLRRARHVHVGSAFLLDALRPDLPGLLAAARDAGATTSVDPNWDPRGTWDGGIGAILRETDVFLPNAAEAERLTGLEDPAAAAAALVAAGPSVVAVKTGPAGALAATSDRRVLRVAAPPVEVCDTTGAGDSFDAGFLAGWIDGHDVAAALTLAVACGSMSTRAAGGVAAQPTLDEARSAAAGLHAW